MDKLWCVKAYQLEEKNSLKIIDFSNEEKKQPSTFTRKLTVVGKDLTWQEAKEMRNKYRYFDASIFPNVKQSKLQIIEL